MKPINCLVIGVLLMMGCGSCTRSHDCDDSSIEPAFIGFKLADVDTLVLRKFQVGTAYQVLIDTFVVKLGTTGNYRVSHDTLTISAQDYFTQGIRAGYDWQLVIPAKHRILAVSEIKGEKKTGECNRGIFSMDPRNCQCSNELFSARVDTKLADFTGAYPHSYRLFIR